MLVHDRWAAHFRCDVYDHQICLAHLFRDLKYIDQVHQSDWAQALTSILKQAIVLNNQADYDPAPAGSGSAARNELERSVMDLLQHKLPDKDKLAIKLQKKLRKISHNILCFLHYNNVPPDNNGSERQ